MYAFTRHKTKKKMELSLCCKNQEITILILDTDVSYLTSKFNEFQCRVVSGTNVVIKTHKVKYTLKHIDFTHLLIVFLATMLTIDY